MQNLRDKLLKAGLVTADQNADAEKETQAKAQVRQEARPPRPANDSRGPARYTERPPQRTTDRPADRPRTNGARPHVSRPVETARPRFERPTEPVEKRIPRLPPLALPGSKAHQRLESLKQVELDKKLRLLAQTSEVPVDVGATVFHFMTRKNRLRRLELTEAQAKQLEEGALAVVERPEPACIEHSLVPREVAERMLSMSPKSVRFWNRDGAPVGFMTDDELKSRQVEEAAAPPELPESEDERAAFAQAESASTQTAEQMDEDAAQAELDAYEARKAQQSG